MSRIRVFQSIRTGILILAVLFVAASFTAGAEAAILQFTAQIGSGQANSCAGTGSPATGLGTFNMDTVSGVVTYNINVDIASLLGSETAAHVHGPAAPCVNGGVVYALPAGPSKTGTTTLTPAQRQDMIDGLHYVNVHTTVWGGGEIRGQILADTLNCSYVISPTIGTVPFITTHSVDLTNLYPLQTRRVAAHIDVQLANGSFIPNWKSGWTNIAAGGTFNSTFNATIPSIGAVIGNNQFYLVAQDVTPSPFNQPPHPPAGDNCREAVTVQANP